MESVLVVGVQLDNVAEPKMTEEQWIERYKKLESKAAEVLALLESIAVSENESDLASLIDSNNKLNNRIVRAVRTLDDRRS